MKLIQLLFVFCTQNGVLIIVALLGEEQLEKQGSVPESVFSEN